MTCSVVQLLPNMVEFWNLVTTALSYFAVFQQSPQNITSPSLNIAVFQKDPQNITSPLNDTRLLNRPFTVIVEGNVGAGKSTLLRHLAANDGVVTFPEAVRSWTNVSGVNLLDKVIHQATRWGTTFQLYSSLTRFKAFYEAKTSQADVVLLERSLYSERYVFVESMLAAGTLTTGEFGLLDRWFRFMTEKAEVDNNVDLIVYIRSDPVFLMKRVNKRGRSEEDDMKQKNLDTVHAYYEDWLINNKFPVPAKVLILESHDQTKEQFLNIIDKYAHQILNKP